MHRQLAICEPLEALHAGLIDGARAADYAPLVVDTVEQIDAATATAVVAYVHRDNVETCLRLIREEVAVIALHDSQSGLSVTTLVAVGAHAILPRGSAATAVTRALTLDDDQLLIVPRKTRTFPLIDIIAMLTDQERAWLTAAASGRTVSEIARTSGQSERTLQRRFHRIYQQLSAHNLTEALMIAAAWGLIGPLA
jgi:DNA-binding NarL/FixJ family response regulator